VIDPGAGDAIAGIGYSSHPTKNIPDDARPPKVFLDARSNALTVPSDHHTVTTTLASKTGKDSTATLTGPGFLDSADIPSDTNSITVSTNSGAIGAPSAPAGTTLSATSVDDEVQHTATVTFSGHVRRPRVSVNPEGGVTVTTAGGSGHASIKLGAFAPGQKARAPKQRVRIHGRTRITRHTPKLKHGRHGYGRRAHRHRHGKK
jgi:hypothetical protein